MNFLKSLWNRLCALWNPNRESHASIPAKASSKSRRSWKKELSSLLDDLDEVFDKLMMGARGGSMTNKKTRKGLKNLGPHIPLETLDEFKQDWVSKNRKLDNATPPRLSCDGKFPGIMFIFNAGGQQEYWDREKRKTRTLYEKAFWKELSLHDYSERWRRSVFQYGVRVRKLPWEVEPIEAVAFYECGAAWQGRSDKKLDWSYYYVAVKKNGDVIVPKLLHEEKVEVPKIGGSQSRGRRAPRRGYYCRRFFDVPQKRQWDPLKKLSDNVIAAVLADEFVDMFNFWKRRNLYWQVRIRRGKETATFCVPQESTKDYFKNRNRTALTSKGRLRPIIHFVNEHQRRLRTGKVTTVKEHIRGLRIFDWSGFHCCIVAPDFHTWKIMEFDIASEHEEDIVFGDNEYYELPEIGAALAEMDETQQRPDFGKAKHITPADVERLKDIA